MLIAVEQLPMFPKFSLPGVSFLKRQTSLILSKVDSKNLFFVGMAMGLIPCGLVYAAGMKAISTGNVLSSSLAMFVFGLGTMPAMILVGSASSFFTQKLKKKIYLVASILLLILGVVTAYNGFEVLSGRSSHDHSNHDSHSHHSHH